MSKWKEMTLGEAVLLNPKVGMTRGQVYPFVEMAAITAGRRGVEPSEYRELSGGSRFEARDTLVARITPCLENGKVARYLPSKAEDSIAFGSTEFIVIRGREGVTDNDYAYYMTSLPEFRQFAISQMNGSSGRQRVAWESLGGFTVNLPPLPTQKSIARILSTLDDKIELNRRMNATLEGMAKAVFREWFGSGMGASPMCMDGSDPSNPSTAHGRGAHATGALPEGWKMGTVGEAFDLTMGQSPPGDTYNEDGVGMPFYQGCTDFGFRFPTRRIFCTAPTRLAKPNDTLVSVRAPVGQLNVATEECCVGRGVAAIRHKSGASSYTYYAVHNLSEHFAKFDGEGTVFGSINKKNFEAIPMVIPPAEIIAEYERKARPMDEQILNLEKQSRSLAALRDSLLPRLLSGEISATSLREIP